MFSPTNRTRFAILVAAGIGMSVAVLTTTKARAVQPDPAQAPSVYHEPDDPALSVLARAQSRIYSDDPKDYTEAGEFPWSARA